MEKITKPITGYLIILIDLLMIPAAVFSFLNEMPILGVICIFLLILIVPGFFIVEPNKSMVLLLFGEYKGTVKANGFFLGKSFHDQKEDFFEG